MKTIIEEGLKNHRVQDIILTDDMVPHYAAVSCVVDEFQKVVIPAIEKTLNELGA